MAHRTLVSLSTGVIAAATLAGSAHATFFSFASDNDHTSYTFRGTAGAAGSFTITEDGPTSPFTLFVDDNNGPLAALPVATRFTANLNATWVASTNIFANVWQHSYSFAGNFQFLDPNTGAAILTITVGPNNRGVFTVPGGQNSWSSAGAILGADSFADVTYTAFPALVAALGGAANAANYGIVIPNGISASSTGPDDLGFDLTVLNSGTMGINVGLDPQTHLPTTTWASESSYSGSAIGGIPTPGATALLACAGLMVARRRRK